MAHYHQAKQGTALLLHHKRTTAVVLVQGKCISMLGDSSCHKSKTYVAPSPRPMRRPLKTKPKTLSSLVLSSLATSPKKKQAPRETKTSRGFFFDTSKGFGFSTSETTPLLETQNTKCGFPRAG